MQVFGMDRQATLARELTKVYETIYSGTLAEMLEWVAADSNQQRGEIVLMIQGAVKSPQLRKLGFDPHKLNKIDGSKP